jgi:hypothetical protein
MPFDWSIKIRGILGKPAQFVPQGGNPGDPLNVNPTMPLYLALGLSPLSVGKICTVIALLHPHDQRQDLLNRIRAQTYRKSKSLFRPGPEAARSRWLQAST